MVTLELLKPSKIGTERCPGLELVTFREVGNPLLGAGNDAPEKLRKLILQRLDDLRKRPMNSKLDGASFTPLVDDAVPARNSLEEAARTIGDEIWSSSASNPMFSSMIFNAYWGKLAKIGFMQKELMTPLLITQEELLFPDVDGGADRLSVSVPVFYAEEDEGGQVGLQPDFMLPPTSAPLEGGDFFGRAESFPKAPPSPKPQPVQPDIIEVRLVSIREMLKAYFREFPLDYAKALASALGLVADESGDEEFMEQRVAFEVARVGSWALALRVLEEVKKGQEKKGDGPDPWRMGLKVGRAKKKPWAYYKAGSRLSAGQKEDASMFCPRWGGLSWGVSIGMLASIFSRG